MHATAGDGEREVVDGDVGAAAKTPELLAETVGLDDVVGHGSFRSGGGCGPHSAAACGQLRGLRTGTRTLGPALVPLLPGRDPGSGRAS